MVVEIAPYLVATNNEGVEARSKQFLFGHGFRNFYAVADELIGVGAYESLLLFCERIVMFLGEPATLLEPSHCGVDKAAESGWSELYQTNIVTAFFQYTLQCEGLQYSSVIGVQGQGDLRYFHKQDIRVRFF